MEISIVASSSIEGEIGSWDLKTGKALLKFKPCASPAHGLTAVGDKFLAASQLRKDRNASDSSGSGSNSGSIFFWSWNKPQVEVRSFLLEPILALAANSEGTYIVGGSGGKPGYIYLWEVATGKLLKKWHGHYRSVTCLVFSGDDSLLVSGSEDGSIKVWSLIRLFDDLQSQQGNAPPEHYFTEHTMSVTDIVMDYGGCNALIVSASEDRTCKVWSLAKGKLLRSIVFPSAINALALDPCGSVFYAGGRDSKIYIGAMNATSDHCTKVLGSISEESKAITCLAYCAEGNHLISGSEDGKICVWDPKTRHPVRTFDHGKGPVSNIQVVRKTIVTNLNKTLSSWKRNGASLPPFLEKSKKSDEDIMDGIVTVEPPPFSDVPVYARYLSANLINEQVRELQQQGSAATEIEMERLKLEYKKSLQMNDQWEKNYENLLKVVMEEQNGASN
ncbi:unnamed protein product [Microthlaspi erraticum]|uniref:Uncharacterized protein n=1 Tax=Microthlaspi erraticum TaxID=1685480 RepID=A0A6D2L8U2_9BRAS|nr:unnamed protein product [Microthlaspi erraticum]